MKPVFLEASDAVLIPPTNLPNVGDFVETCDGSYAATVRKNGLEHNAINAYGIKQRYNWRLVAIDCELPAFDNHDTQQNDAVIVDQNSGDVVFIQRRFLVRKGR